MRWRRGGVINFKGSQFDKEILLWGVRWYLTALIGSVCEILHQSPQSITAVGLARERACVQTSGGCSGELFVTSEFCDNVALLFWIASMTGSPDLVFKAWQNGLEEGILNKSYHYLPGTGLRMVQRAR